MVVLDPGHVYQLNILDGPWPEDSDDLPGVLRFVKREGANYPGNVGSFPGTTLQEVLRACTNRLRYVNAQKPCEETELAHEHLQQAIYLLECRAAQLHKREPPVDLYIAEAGDLCEKCGHVGCKGECK